MTQSDPGAIKAIMDATPDYATHVGDTTTFWYAFGPVLYRGRVDGSARVIGIASDACHCSLNAFVGQAGKDTAQRVQHFG